MNSLMIKEYCKISPLLRQVVIAIKQWAKPIGLNKPSGPGPITFSSYALTLMTIALFQVRRPVRSLHVSDTTNTRPGEFYRIYKVAYHH